MLDQPLCPFALEVQVRGDHALVTVGGELDAGTCAELDAALNGLTASGVRRITLSMGAVTFVDSSGLRCLARVGAAVPAVFLTVADAPEHLRQLLAVTGIDEMLTIL